MPYLSKLSHRLALIYGAGTAVVLSLGACTPPTSLADGLDGPPDQNNSNANLPGAGPHAPAGLSTRWRPFDGSALPGQHDTPNAYGMLAFGEDQVPDLEVVRDDSKPSAARGGPWVLRDAIPVGPSAQAARFHMQTDLGSAHWRTIYIRYWWKSDSEWQRGIKSFFPRIAVTVSGNGQTSWGPYDVSNRRFEEWENGFFEGAGPDGMRVEYQLQSDTWWDGVTKDADGQAVPVRQTGSGWTEFSAAPLPQLGVWREYEWVLRLNTPGQRDGVVQAWVDGVQKINVTNALLVPAYVAMPEDIGGASRTVGVKVDRAEWNYLFWETTFDRVNNVTPQSLSIAGWYVAGAP